MGVAFAWWLPKIIFLLPIVLAVLAGSPNNATLEIKGARLCQLQAWAMR